MNVDYYLVSAARRAHRLRPGKTYVFGREEGVDIVLQDALVSRRHAEMRWGESESWMVVDLGSRNGLMVNNQRLGAPTQMRDGDQLQIGGMVFRFHCLPPGGDPGSLSNQAPQISNLETMGPGFSIKELAQQSATFTGIVSSGGVMELLQFFQVTGKGGRLDLMDSQSVIASVWLDAGGPAHAKYGALTGYDALVALAQQPPARFAFHADATPTQDRSLEGSSNGILMEVARMLDEQRR